MSLLELLQRPTVLAPTVLLVGYVIYQILFSGPKLPSHLPIVGAKEGDWFPLLQARWRNALDFKAAVIKADAEFGGQTAILPLAGSGGDKVMLPRSETQFVTDQPDNILSMHVEVTESLQFQYTSIDSNLVTNPVHHHLITTTLTNQTGNLVPDVYDETQWAVSKHLGNDTEFHDLCVFDTMARIISSVTNRVFVGAPMCRDPELLRLSLAYAARLPIIGQTLRAVLKPLRPAAALILTLPLRIIMRNFTAVLHPEISQRLAEYDANLDTEKSSPPKHNDFLQWLIAQAKSSGDPYMYSPRTLASRILLMNFAAIHTSTFSMTHTILDLIASDPKYVDELREEISTVLAEHGGEWNKRALAKMYKLDSVLRESMRLNSFVTVGLSRRVVAKEGITTPSGVKLPYGSTVVVPSYTVFHDDEVYPDAGEFKPFRFADERKDESVGYVKRAGKAFATTGKDYLAFGHGKYACPGRFFAANELKLILGVILMDYEFEFKEGRERNKWYGMVRVPPMKARVRIRKRA
jgi:cytochrome P450